MNIREVGQNRGRPYDLFMKRWGYGPGTMWCGLFCHTVFVEANVKHGVKGPALAANWAVPKGVIIWKFGTAIKNKPPPLSSDLALFTFGSGRIRHVGIIVNWPPDGPYCYVIEGNTSNPVNARQEGVFLKKRLKREMIVVTRIAPLT